MDNFMSRLGKRGSFLLIMGLIEVARGYSIIVDPPLRRPDTRVLHDLIPPPWYGILWIVCGVIGIAYAFTITHGRDRKGFGMQIFPPMFTTASYVGSWVLTFFGQAGDPRGWVSSILFVALVALIFLVSGWAEPKSRLPIDKLIGGPTNGDS